MPTWEVGNSVRQQGFTLLEMLAVLVLLSIAYTLLAAGITRGITSVRERQSVTELMQGMRQARAQAIFEGRPVSLHFDLLKACYGGQQRPLRCLNSNLQLRVEVAAALAGETVAITFYPDGSSSGGNVRVTSASGEARIDVSWLTGNVKIVDAVQ
ncbi:GspH/FimT family pseudopilin [Pseudomonas brenneri]|nr:GspH/FimT family pseudopilin [Pseudomonas brenneri]